MLRSALERDSPEFESLSLIRPQTPSPSLPHCFQSKLTNYLQLKHHALFSLLGLIPRPWESSSPWLGLEGGLASKVQVSKSVRATGREGREEARSAICFLGMVQAARPSAFLGSGDLGLCGACEGWEQGLPLEVRSGRRACAGAEALRVNLLRRSNLRGRF